MSKKKQKGNGFFVFMKEMQEDLRRQGKNVSMRNMPNFAGPKWAQFSDAKKQAYSAIAKKEWNSAYGIQASSHPDLKPPLSGAVPRPGRMDSTGQLLSERRDKGAEMSERRRKEKEVIQTSFPPGMAAVEENFYFIDFQSLCEISMKDEKQWMPCEVALVEFSLKHGVKRKFQKFIDPGKIPMGYRYLAQSTSDTTHQIPISEFEQAEKDYRKILGEIELFLDPDWTENMPPIYSKRSRAEMCEWSLGWLADKAGVLNRLTKVYEMETLIELLSGHLEGRPIGYFQISELLNTSVYDYEAGTRCDFHEECGSKYCSLGEVNIYTYVAAECLCPLFGISLSSAHLPKLSVGGTVTSTKFKTRSGVLAKDLDDDSDSANDDVVGPPPPLPMVSFGRGKGLGRGQMGRGLVKPRQVGGLRM